MLLLGRQSSQWQKWSKTRWIADDTEYHLEPLFACHCTLLQHLVLYCHLLMYISSYPLSGVCLSCDFNAISTHIPAFYSVTRTSSNHLHSRSRCCARMLAMLLTSEVEGWCSKLRIQRKFVVGETLRWEVETSDPNNKEHFENSTWSHRADIRGAVNCSVWSGRYSKQLISGHGPDPNNSHQCLCILL